jgi:hypothetical protein
VNAVLGATAANAKRCVKTAKDSPDATAVNAVRDAKSVFAMPLKMPAVYVSVVDAIKNILKITTIIYTIK